MQVQGISPGEGGIVSLELRPSFSIGLSEPSGTVLRRLRARMRAPHVEVRWAQRPGGGGPMSTREDQDHVVLCIVENERHFWSPWLMVDIAEQDGGTHLYARFSPHPSVWTGFAFCYLTLGAIGFFSLIFAWASQLSGSGKPIVGLIAPVCALIAFGLWWASQVGQKLAHPEMRTLRGCLDAALASAEDEQPHS
jgi:hypothetical protein